MILSWQRLNAGRLGDPFVAELGRMLWRRCVLHDSDLLEVHHVARARPGRASHSGSCTSGPTPSVPRTR